MSGKGSASSAAWAAGASARSAQSTSAASGSSHAPDKEKTQWRGCIPVISVADPDQGSGAFLTPGSGMGKKSGAGSGMNNPDHISESLETIFWGKNT
jgi:hypothetical protein